MSTDPVLQYRRVFELLIGKASTGDGAVANQDFRIKFEITKTIKHTPNHAEFLIYNLADDTESRIKGEFDEVQCNAGYQREARLVFAGNLVRPRRYREGNDQITQLIAGDGDGDYYGTVINTVLAAGTTDSDVLNHIVSQFKSTKLGNAAAVAANKGKRSRAKVMNGMARDYLHQIAAAAECDWSIQNGVLHFIPFEGTLPGEAIVIRADTGMLKAPEVTDKGIKAWCLLNPAIKIGGVVQLDNNDLKEELRTITEQAAGAKKPGKKVTKKKHGPARMDPDGLYKVISLTHKGDTLGKEWHTESLCVSLSKPIPAKKAA
jgi:hypothetical protein